MEAKPLAEVPSDVIERRFVAAETGLNTALKRFQLLQQSVAAGDADGVDTMLQGLLLDLDHLDLAAARVLTAQQTNERAVQSFHKARDHIDGATKVVKKNLADLERTLSVEKTIRQHREEYDELAAVIMAQRPRDATTADLEQERKRIADLEAEHARLAHQLAARKQQFYLFFHALAELRNSFDKETNAD
eukprot:NODE_4378_length_789_cov_42.616314_g4355_i0.p2 GENE.NODE_4378_length_789_cov_42.616314_g4355_i0~~NODE_4378_length_789_cov_42.616314_g4355_i0.p2  ORF type:complete len:213 (+),score=87.14 NODE_4378_length_789_cov_42.616314_g4355_i0:70-639(+)